MMEVNFKLLSAGFCYAYHHHALRGAKKEKIKFFATFGLIEHPDKGYILFDTGYTRDFYKQTKSFPYSLYARSTKVEIDECQEAKYQLAHLGVKAEEIGYIIISHFHADHIGGLKDFPNAQFIASRKAYEDVKNRRGFSAVRKGFIPGFLPSDFEERLVLLDLEKGGSVDKDLGKLLDVFEDNSLILCSLDGHAKGQIGLLCESNGKEIFLVADGALVIENYRDLIMPSRITSLFIDSWSECKRSLQKINAFSLSHPDAIIIPCHCEETFDLIGNKIRL